MKTVLQTLEIEGLRGIFRNRNMKDVATLSTGTGAAQVIGFLAIPIVLRLFSTEQYSNFAIFTSWLLILEVIITGGLYQAVVAAGSDRQAFVIRKLCSLSTILVSALSFVSILTFATSSQTWLYMLPLALFVVGLSQTEMGWQHRFRGFDLIAQAKVGQTLASVGSQILAGLAGLGIWGLTGSSVISFFTSFLLLRRRQPVIEQSAKPSRHELVMSLKESYRFPLYSMPSALLSLGSRLLPGLIFPFFAMSSHVGYIFLAFKVLYLPVVLISHSVGRVFYSRITAQRHLKRRGLLLRIYISLGALIAPPLLIVYVWAPELFGLVFGEQWSAAGNYARLMIPWFGLYFVMHPGTHLYNALSRQNRNFAIQFGVFSLQVISVASLLYLGFDSMQSVAAYAGIGAIGSSALILDTLWLAHQADRMSRTSQSTAAK